MKRVPGHGAADQLAHGIPVAAAARRAPAETPITPRSRT